MKQMLYAAGPDSASEVVNGSGHYGMIKGAARENAAGEAMPVVVAQGAADDGYGIGTRAYTWGNRVRTAFTGTSTTEAALPAMGASRELTFVATARCWLRFGATGLAAAQVGDGFLVLADQYITIRMNSGETHFRVIREAADGNLTIYPVA